jgi:hypothetical protein
MDEKSKQPDPLAQRFKLNGSYPSPEGPANIKVGHVKTGFSLMFGAGTLVGLAGHRLRRAESDRHGSSHARSVQGLHHHQQFHDRRDRGGERGNLLEPRLH